MAVREGSRRGAEGDRLQAPAHARPRHDSPSADMPELAQGAGAPGLPRDAADPPLRGEGRPDVRHGPDRRLLPPLHRPGSRRRRHADGDRRGRPGHHRLSRPRPHAGLRHGPQGRHGRADRAPRRLFQGQGRLDAHVLPREELLSAATASSARRSRSAPASPSPTAIARTTTSASPISATARPTRARSTRASTWRSCGSCRCIYIIENNRYAMGTSVDRVVGADRSLQARRLVQHSRRAGRRHGRARVKAAGEQGGRTGAATARARTSWRC